MKKDAWSMFIMDLASYLHKSVYDVLTGMNSVELSQWMTYFRIKKMVGEERQDYRIAMLAYTTAIAFGGKKAKRLTITDFIPFYQRIRPTGQQLISKLMNFVKHFSQGKEKNGRK